MSYALQLKTRILPGNRIEVQAPELPEGRLATVFIVLAEDESPKRPLGEVIGNYAGRQLFNSAEEIDAYLRAERNTWAP